MRGLRYPTNAVGGGRVGLQGSRQPDRLRNSDVDGGRLKRRMVTADPVSRKAKWTEESAAPDQDESPVAGLSTRTPSGGIVRFSEYGLPCSGRGSASTRPLFPCPLPP